MVEYLDILKGAFLMSNDKKSIQTVTPNSIPELLGGFSGFTALMQPEQKGQRRFKGRINVPQALTKTHMKPDGLSAYTGYLHVSSSEDMSGGKYVKNLHFLFVVPFQTRITEHPFRVGRRSHPKMALGADGKWEKDMSSPNPVCESPNGVFPMSNVIGTEVIDIRDNSSVTIGKNSAGEWISETMAMSGNRAAPKICQNCPLGNWKYVNGRPKPPPCRPQTSYAIWVLPHPEGYQPSADEDILTEEDAGLYYIMGSNGGVEEALVGVAAGGYGCNIDGGALPGILHFFSVDDSSKEGPIQVIIETEKLQPHQRRFVTSYTDKKTNGTLTTEKEDKYAVLLIPRLRNAPEGFPADVGSDTPLFSVQMSVVRNSFTRGGKPNPTLVPTFNLTDYEVKGDQKTQYLEAFETMSSEAVLSNYLRLDQAEIVLNRVKNEMISVNAPKSTNEVNDDSIIDVEFTEEDDI